MTIKQHRQVNVYSEIGILKTVVLHRPGPEIENLTPSYLEKLLFDDIPYLKVARQEHDYFAQVLSDNGVEVLYLEELAADVLRDKVVRLKFLNDFIAESSVDDSKSAEKIMNFLNNISEKEIINTLVSGLRKSQAGLNEDQDQYPFILDPMPNLYFTRDSFASIGRGVAVNSMKFTARKRESIFPQYIFKYHKEFANANIPLWYTRNQPFSLEGGDVLVLSRDVLAIGNSQRSDKEAILKLAENILSGQDTFKIILMFEIPKARTFMHLDTVFTMVDYDKFTIHKEIDKQLKVRAVTYDAHKKIIVINDENGGLENILSKYLGFDVTLIRCGGEDTIVSAREQWNDGSNTLAISPGKVVTYERNYVTNEALVKNNITVIAIPSSELSRGRGGPRCMSMPIYRENI